MVRKMTLASRCAALSRRSASNPSITGMAMSATITSGRSRWAASISVCPSPTVPTRSKSSRRKLASPCATIIWSSANSTLARCMLFLQRCPRTYLQWYPDPQLGATPWLCHDVHASLPQTHPFADADQPQSAVPPCCRQVEPPPVVGDPQLQDVIAACQGHFCLACPRVSRHVAQRLLGHPIQAQCHIRRDLLQV